MRKAEVVTVSEVMAMLPQMEVGKAGESYAIRSASIQEKLIAAIEALQDLEGDGCYYGEGHDSEKEFDSLLQSIVRETAMMRLRGVQARTEYVH